MNVFSMEKFKDWNIRIPLIQGGMGVGISRGGLAGAVAAEGAIGVISSAQLGFEEPDFVGNEQECNLRCIRREIARAKELSKGCGMVAVNIMVALQQYREHVKEAVKAGADAIICGAGLPVDLPDLVGNAKVRIAPIVSSAKALHIIMRMWDHHYHRVPDFIVVEGPKAGGHLGFHQDQLADVEAIDMDQELVHIISKKQEYEKKYGCSIPVFAAGGIWDSKDAAHVRDLGADGVQVGTRFVATRECDASDAYKQAYVDARSEDAVIIKSPVGLPGRALNNAFIQRITTEKENLTRCYHCIRTCKPAEIPYCITNALVHAVQGDLEHGLIFCGSNVGRIQEISTVHEVISDIMTV